MERFVNAVSQEATVPPKSYVRGLCSLFDTVVHNHRLHQQHHHHQTHYGAAQLNNTISNHENLNSNNNNNNNNNTNSYHQENHSMEVVDRMIGSAYESQQHCENSPDNLHNSTSHLNETNEVERNNRSRENGDGLKKSYSTENNISNDYPIIGLNINLLNRDNEKRRKLSIDDDDDDDDDDDNDDNDDNDSENCEERRIESNRMMDSREEDESIYESNRHNNKLVDTSEMDVETYSDLPKLNESNEIETNNNNNNNNNNKLITDNSNVDNVQIINELIQQQEQQQHSTLPSTISSGSEKKRKHRRKKENHVTRFLFAKEMFARLEKERELTSINRSSRKLTKDNYPSINSLNTNYGPIYRSAERLNNDQRRSSAYPSTTNDDGSLSGNVEQININNDHVTMTWTEDKNDRLNNHLKMRSSSANVDYRKSSTKNNETNSNRLPNNILPNFISTNNTITTTTTITTVIPSTITTTTITDESDSNNPSNTVKVDDVRPSIDFNDLYRKFEKKISKKKIDEKSSNLSTDIKPLSNAIVTTTTITTTTTTTTSTSMMNMMMRTSETFPNSLTSDNRAMGNSHYFRSNDSSQFPSSTGIDSGNVTSSSSNTKRSTQPTESIRESSNGSMDNVMEKMNELRSGSVSISTTEGTRKTLIQSEDVSNFENNYNETFVENQSIIPRELDDSNGGVDKGKYILHNQQYFEFSKTRQDVNKQEDSSHTKDSVQYISSRPITNDPIHLTKTNNNNKENLVNNVISSIEEDNRDEKSIDFPQEISSFSFTSTTNLPKKNNDNNEKEKPSNGKEDDEKERKKTEEEIIIKDNLLRNCQLSDKENDDEEKIEMMKRKFLNDEKIEGNRIHLTSDDEGEEEEEEDEENEDELDELNENDDEIVPEEMDGFQIVDDEGNFRYLISGLPLFTDEVCKNNVIEMKDDDVEENEKRRKVKFSANPIVVHSTYSANELDRRNYTVDPISASAEYELEKRIDRMHIFYVTLEKFDDTLPFNIIGLGVGADSGIEKLGMFIKTINDNLIGEAVEELNVYDQLIEVNGISLVGVSVRYAATTLRQTGRIIHLLIGREKNLYTSEIARLISKSLQDDNLYAPPLINSVDGLEKNDPHIIPSTLTSKIWEKIGGCSRDEIIDNYRRLCTILSNSIDNRNSNNNSNSSSRKKNSIEREEKKTFEIKSSQTDIGLAYFMNVDERIEDMNTEIKFNDELVTNLKKEINELNKNQMELHSQNEQLKKEMEMLKKKLNEKEIELNVERSSLNTQLQQIKEEQHNKWNVKERRYEENIDQLKSTIQQQQQILIEQQHKYQKLKKTFRTYQQQKHRTSLNDQQQLQQQQSQQQQQQQQQQQHSLSNRTSAPIITNEMNNEVKVVSDMSHHHHHHHHPNTNHNNDSIDSTETLNRKAKQIVNNSHHEIPDRRQSKSNVLPNNNNNNIDNQQTNNNNNNNNNNQKVSVNKEREKLNQELERVLKMKINRTNDHDCQTIHKSSIHDVNICNRSSNGKYEIKRIPIKDEMEERKENVYLKLSQLESADTNDKSTTPSFPDEENQSSPNHNPPSNRNDTVKSDYDIFGERSQALLNSQASYGRTAIAPKKQRRTVSSALFDEPSNDCFTTYHSSLLPQHKTKRESNNEKLEEENSHHLIEENLLEVQQKIEVDKRSVIEDFNHQIFNETENTTKLSNNEPIFPIAAPNSNCPEKSLNTSINSEPKKVKENGIDKKGLEDIDVDRIRKIILKDLENSPTDTTHPRTAPHTWTVREVADWLRIIGLVHYSELFITQSVDGKTLINANSHKLKDLGVMNQCERSTIRRSLKELKKRLNEQPHKQKQQQQQQHNDYHSNGKLPTPLMKHHSSTSADSDKPIPLDKMKNRKKLKYDDLIPKRFNTSHQVNNNNNNNHNGYEERNRSSLPSTRHISSHRTTTTTTDTFGEHNFPTSKLDNVRMFFLKK
ncbi:hypothetical protein SNEBB_001496 [Seison nebaliae]|nr:hypothetical protein SNEBB_001496 [Seison nebaliae]